MEEQKIEVDNKSQTPLHNLDSLHWTNALVDQVENEPDLRNTQLTNELNEVIYKIILTRPPSFFDLLRILRQILTRHPRPEPRSWTATCRESIRFALLTPRFISCTISL